MKFGFEKGENSSGDDAFDATAIDAEYCYELPPCKICIHHVVFYGILEGLCGDSSSVMGYKGECSNFKVLEGDERLEVSDI